MMARIRSIKPEFWTSEQVAECSPNARLLFIGLWNFCDDQGIHPASVKSLKMQIFPGDNFTISDIENMVIELIHQRLLFFYQAEGKGYWYVTGWANHQKIDKPNKKFPAPDKESVDRFVAERSENDRRLFADHLPEEGKGREGKGKDKNLHAMTRTEQMLREAMADKRGMLAGKYPHLDLDIELEEMVAKYRNESIGADAFLLISRWLKQVHDHKKRSPPPAHDPMATIMKGVK